MDILTLFYREFFQGVLFLHTYPLFYHFTHKASYVMIVLQYIKGEIAMLKKANTLRTASRIILRLGFPMILGLLLYTCYYITNAIPDGGVMLNYQKVAAELLGNAIAALGILIAAAAIPEVKLF